MIIFIFIKKPYNWNHKKIYSLNPIKNLQPIQWHTYQLLGWMNKFVGLYPAKI